METSSTKKTLFRALMVVLCLLALGVFFQTGQSQSMFSTAPLPTLQVTLPPGVEWVTVRTLPVEDSTIWQENGQVFGISHPIINSARDAALFEELIESRLDSLPDDQVLTAEVTFKTSLSLTEVETLLGRHNIATLLASGEGGSTGRVAYPPDDMPAEVQENFGEIFESLSGGTPAPILSPDNYIAAKIRGNAFLLRTLSHDKRVFTVDVGPVDLVEYFPNGDFSPLKDVSYEYGLQVGSLCNFASLRNRIDDLSTTGEISATVSNELIDILNGSETYYHAGNIASSRNEMALFFDTLTDSTDSSMEDALKEVRLIGDCLVADKMQYDTLIWNPPLSLSDPYNASGGALPVKFSVVDLSGEFVHSENVRLELFDENGSTVKGPLSFSPNPNEGITITGKQYHHNLNLKNVPTGSYILYTDENCAFCLRKRRNFHP